MLWFWVIVLVAIIGAVAVVAVGRGDSMAEVYDDRPDTSVPTSGPLRAEDLQAVRFNTGVRGYRMDEVDALLARLEAQMLDRETGEERAENPPSDAAEPAVPAEAAGSAVPAVPAAPAGGAEPAVPAEPAVSAKPAVPTEPTEPARPAVRARPAVPAEPTEPVDSDAQTRAAENNPGES